MAAQSNQNAILKIDLHPELITNPRITRTLSCPASATFADLHQALLIAFGWMNAQSYNFQVLDHSDTQGSNHVFLGVKPLCTIANLEQRRNYPGDILDSSKISLFNILEDSQTMGKAILYNYGLQDIWKHNITCIGRADVTTQFVCLKGEGHSATEDVGGLPGWKELLDAYDARNPTRSQKDKMSWFENHASNKDTEGLRGEKKWRWDKDRINSDLAKIGGASLDTSNLSNRFPSLLVISLDKASVFDETYSQILDKLRSKANVIEASHIVKVLQHLRKPKQEFAAIIVTDPVMMEDDEFDRIQEKLVQYAQNGGTVVLGFLHSNLGQSNDINQAFQTVWGLGWQIGDYKLATCSRNARLTSPQVSQAPNLVDEYKTIALHIRGSQLEDQVYASSLGNDQSSAIVARYGKGYLGWIGGLDMEPGTMELLFAISGV